MTYKLAIFDFDGTLANSFPFFVSVFNDLAREHGFRTVEAREVEELRGYGARELMTRLEMPAWKLPRVAAAFTALMRKNITSVPLFEGVSELLPRLKSRGVALAIVSSNAEDNVREVLGVANSGLIGHFECGMSIFGKRSRIRKVLRASAIPHTAAIYIGDQETDLEAAHRERVAFGAVSWGYGDIAALRARSPAEEFATVADIEGIAGSFT